MAEYVSKIRDLAKRLRDTKETALDAFEMMNAMDDISYELDSVADGIEEANHG